MLNNSKKTIIFAADHAGFDLKNAMIKHLETQNIATCDLGSHDTESVDYADYAHALAKILDKNEAEIGVLICGTGIGISISANRHNHIHAALCHNEEMAELARQHNNANVLVLGARFIETPLALKMLDKFLQTCFEGGRHNVRIEKINQK